MPIPASVQGVVDFIKENDTLIKDINETAEVSVDQIKKLVNRLDQTRKETEQLLQKLGSTKFVIAKRQDVQNRQQVLLAKIEEVSKEIQVWKDDPTIAGLLLAARGELYQRMANTYNYTVSKVIRFSQEEVDKLDVLIRRSILDTQSRKKKAHILDGAIQMAKILFRIGKKLVMA
jgi:DNA repair exonuclease SbcCD ATPase subunit